MARFKKRSVLPIYAIALVWIIFTLVHPLYRASDYVSVILLSAVVFIVAKGIFPTIEYELPDPQPEEDASAGEEPPSHESTQQEDAQEDQNSEKEEKSSTGDPKIDALIQEKDRALSEMRRLNDAIEDTVISQRIDQLEQATSKIIDQVLAHPEKLPQIRKFMNYYLPTTMKLLKSYSLLERQSYQGENIVASRHDIEEILGTLVHAFEKQLDQLFAADAVDISSDITVLETMIAKDGLSHQQGVNLHL